MSERRRRRPGRAVGQRPGGRPNSAPSAPGPMARPAGGSASGPFTRLWPRGSGCGRGSRRPGAGPPKPHPSLRAGVSAPELEVGFPSSSPRGWGPSPPKHGHRAAPPSLRHSPLGQYDGLGCSSRTGVRAFFGLGVCLRLPDLLGTVGWHLGFSLLAQQTRLGLVTPCSQGSPDCPTASTILGEELGS